MFQVFLQSQSMLASGCALCVSFDQVRKTCGADRNSRAISTCIVQYVYCVIARGPDRIEVN